MVSVTSVEAQNRFGQLMDMAQREIVAVTRHGRTAAFIVSPRDMEELLERRGGGSHVGAELDAWREQAAGNRTLAQTTAAAEQTGEAVTRLVNYLR